jgi:ubiquinone biosynthesis monooxygenase Coq7
MSGPENPVDRAILTFDQALRTLFPHTPARPARPSPAAGLPEPALPEPDRQLAIGLMRVNHVGEICAQALYRGQALGARNTVVREALLAAAAEETDHLRWCEERLSDLHGSPSVLNPLWYAGAFGIGAVASAFGEEASLGFVVETERQVEAHLDGHLDRLPPADTRSRAVVEQMKVDEARHAADALARGGRVPPRCVARLMAWQAKVMTTLAFWI